MLDEKYPDGNAQKTVLDYQGTLLCPADPISEHGKNLCIQLIHRLK